MQWQRRQIVLWVPFVLVSVIHLVALTFNSGVAGPTKLFLMPLLALPVVGAGRGHVVGPIRTLLLVALGFSWLGDGAGAFFPNGLELPLMLAFFGCAHIAYIVLFVRYLNVRRLPRWVAIYALWWVVMVAVIGPHTGALLIPVALYGLVLAGTAATAGGCGPMVAIGGAFFLTSDSLLAWRLFLPDAAPGWFGPAVMATYTLGQGLIVAGVLRQTKRRESVFLGAG
ncbi:lysoplasmalogenase [Gordonia sp. (in: high G+C Gram-positive bacteria)]|uniref:lysoplasmalogenase n=2 Tax=Gordonia sp. (in: high G+C Gram-positive bacteria) TaxID=84139 RepID=UPI003C728C81